MKVQYLLGFLRDLKALKSSQSFSTIKSLVFAEIPSYSSSEDIKNLKKLKETDNAYRSRLGDYRIGVIIENEVITFARVLHRKEIYRYFP